MTGTITAPSPSFGPVNGIDVLLARGDLWGKLDEVVRKEATALTVERRQSALANLEAEATRLNSELAAAQKTLDSHPIDRAAQGGPCSAYDASANEARRAFEEVFTAAADSLRGLGIEPRSPEETVRELEQRVAAQVEKEARDLSDQWAARNLRIESRVVLAAGGRDQLCWTVTNPGTIAVSSLRFTLSHDGKPVPHSLAARFWAVGNVATPITLVIRDTYGQEVRGLADGASFERCAYAAKIDLSSEDRRLADELAIPQTAATRDGKWAVEWHDPILQVGPKKKDTNPDGTAPRWVYEERPLTEIFAADLAAHRKGWESARLLDALTQGDEAVAAQRATAAADACREVARLHPIAERARKALAASKAGKLDDKNLEEYLDSFIKQAVIDPTRIMSISGKAERSMEGLVVSLAKSQPNGSFNFHDIEAGAYTIVATARGKDGTTFTWTHPVEVGWRTTTQDLPRSAAKPGTIGELVETRITGKPAAPRPTLAIPTPGAAPKTKRPAAPKKGH